MPRSPLLTLALCTALGAPALAGPSRPQEPLEPYPYRCEEVSYGHGDVRLAATLTLPEGEGPFPAALLITGSGAQNRDEEILGHKPFKLIADHLTRAGIAVLRADDRGVGGSNDPTPGQSTSADFADDALAGVAFLAAHPAIDPARIGLIGHSEGGLIGPLAASRSDAVAFVVLLARKLLGIGIADPMSGFFMLRRARFDEVAPRLQKAGFKILADMLAASGGRWQAAEIPYEFRPRHEGESKMSAGVTLEFLALLLSHRAGARIPLRLMSYMAVGASGVGVQVATSGLLHGLAGAPLMVSLATGVLAAMTSNFFLNNRITYRDRALRNRALARGLLSFYAIGAIGAVANVLGADWVYGALHSLPVASSSGALLSMMWNFGANSLVTWPL